MIECLSNYFNAFLIESLLVLGFTEVVVEALVQGVLIILVLLLIWIFHRISHRPLKRLIENKMATSKDWIEISKYGCGWRCVRNNFTTVKAQNFDNTTTTIPIYSMLNEYFKN